ncbi:MAG: hypothetical protein WC003_17360, partial [Terrimicrobiaceae bacterium]
WVLHLVAGATLIRFALGMYTAFFGNEDTLLFIPGINFVPAGGIDSSDLRFSGSMLATVAICYFCIYRSFFARGFLLPVIGAAVWGTFLGGGRITLVLLLGLFGFAFLVYRRYGTLLLWASVMFLAILFLNSVPQILYSFPEQPRRAASAFLLERDLAADAGQTGPSDRWHERLMEAGWKSWTEDGMTILFGRGVKPFEERAWMEGANFEGMVEMATVTSRFEKGLWDVLCTFGIVGFVLYSLLLFKIIKYCTPILFKEKIKTPVHAIMFIAVYQCIAWFILCWISGSFPSTQILFGIVAMVAAHDMKRERDAELKGTSKTEIPTLTAATGNR